LAAVSAGCGATALVAKTLGHTTARVPLKARARFLGGQMNRPRIVNREEWLAARRELLVKEKEASHHRDALSADRRALPMVRLEKEYVFDGPDGRQTLRDLFNGRTQLIIYHFMFDPQWEEGCKSCSHFMDNAAGSIEHLPARNTSFAVVSRAPLHKLEAFKQRMGWSCTWVSSGDNDFNHDFGVTIDPERPPYEYNYTSAKTLLAKGKVWFPKGELPGLSVFLRDDDRVFHTYSAYQRGLDLLLNTYNFLDLTPLGRQEEDGRIQAWIRHHDRYPA
jgi:predicted dithiol-disulfide oxidoreductase (DUF899 family)